MKLAYSNTVLAADDDGKTVVVDVEPPSTSASADTVEIVGLGHVSCANALGFRQTLRVVVNRQFASQAAASWFAITHNAELARIRGEGLEFTDYDGQTYSLPDAVLEGVEHERTGVSISSVYTFAFGDAIFGHVLTVKRNGVSVVLRLGDAILTTKRI